MEIQRRAERHAGLRSMEGLRVEQLMSQPVETVMPDCSLVDAAHKLVTRRISGLPVVDAEGVLQGIITEADFLRAIGVPAHHPAHNLWQTLEAMFERHHELREPEGTVADLMVRDVITLEPGQTVHEVIDAMKRHHIKRIVVCDESRRVHGMITRSDLVRVFFDRIRAAGER